MNLRLDIFPHEKNLIRSYEARLKEGKGRKKGKNIYQVFFDIGPQENKTLNSIAPGTSINSLGLLFYQIVHKPKRGSRLVKMFGNASDSIRS